MKKWIKDKAGWIITIAVGAIITQTVVYFRSDIQDVKKADKEVVQAADEYVFDYCNTMVAEATNIVSDDMPMLYLNYPKILRLLPSPYNSYELRGYVGNENGIIIGNSQTNAHGSDIWGPTFYANDFTHRQYTSFKGNGFHIPNHLSTGNYTYIMQFIFHTEYGDKTCTKIVPFKINRQ